MILDGRQLEDESTVLSSGITKDALLIMALPGDAGVGESSLIFTRDGGTYEVADPRAPRDERAVSGDRRVQPRRGARCVGAGRVRGELGGAALAAVGGG